MHMLGDLWLKSPLTAQPLSSNVPGCRYLGQLSISFLSGAGASSLQRPAGHEVSVFNEIHRISTLSVATSTMKRTVIVNNYYEMSSSVRGTTNSTLYVILLLLSTVLNLHRDVSST